MGRKARKAEAKNSMNNRKRAHKEDGIKDVLSHLVLLQIRHEKQREQHTFSANDLVGKENWT